jgi:queuine/archaeosine tRNA-ribosyltransferase
LHLTFQCLRPLEPGGKGPLKEYTRAMLHSIVTKETVAAQLITWHNLWFMLNLLTETWMIWSW